MPLSVRLLKRAVCTTLAITTLLKTGAESSVGRLMKQITAFMSDIPDEFKIVVVEAIQTLCLKFPAKHRTLMNFLSGILREEGGFEFKGTLFSKVYVNGAAAHPLFKYMKTSIPIPMDPLGDTKENGCDDVDALILPRGGFDATTVALWSPVCRSDIAWNFEKFLLDKTGAIVKRYSRYYPIADIATDIEALL